VWPIALNRARKMKLLFPSFKNEPGKAYSATAAIAVVLLLLPLVVGHFGGNFWVRTIDMALLYVMLALGLNIVVGYAGLLDLGYVAFYAVGAYMYALLASPHLAENFEWIAATFPNGLHSSIWLIVPLGALLAAGFGAALGAPTLKLRGDYLAIVTLGFGEIVRIFMNNLNSPINITNGPQGITKIDSVSIFGIDLGQKIPLGPLLIDTTQLYYYLFLALCIHYCLYSLTKLSLR
jgi:branched-chain amino acid transport system permease protein